MQKRPKCFNTERQDHAGKTAASSQRYRCMFCGSKYTPEKKVQGYDAKVRIVEEHKYFTTSARSLRNGQKSLNIAKLKITLKALTKE